MNIKNITHFTVLALSLVLALSAGSCFNEIALDGGYGTVTINLGLGSSANSFARSLGGGANAPYDHILRDTVFTVYFTPEELREKEEYFTRTFRGSGSGTVNVPAGIYSSIWIEASYNDIVYAYGDPDIDYSKADSIEITAGRNDPINVIMKYEQRIGFAVPNITLQKGKTYTQAELFDLLQPFHFSPSTANMPYYWYSLGGEYNINYSNNNLTIPADSTAPSFEIFISFDDDFWNNSEYRYDAIANVLLDPIPDTAATSNVNWTTLTVDGETGPTTPHTLT